MILFLFCFVVGSDSYYWAVVIGRVTLFACIGVYLPLLWESSFCWKTPIALAYTRGHFSALVPLCTVALQPQDDSCHVTYLPLVDSAGRLLCVHYLSEQEVGSSSLAVL